MTTPEPVHSESETHPWRIDIPDHPPRVESAEYRAARARMNEMAGQSAGLIYGSGPYQDHHGGSLWLKDARGWFMVRNLAGIEWSAQFCADPAKVDLLRQNAQRLYAMIAPEIAQELDPDGLLGTRIVDAAGVARWTDSIFNAGVPLHPGFHTGVLPSPGTGRPHGAAGTPGAAEMAGADVAAELSGAGGAAEVASLDAAAELLPGAAETAGAGAAADPIAGDGAAANAGPAVAEKAAGTAVPGSEPGGVHHYPTPIADIQLFKYDDFQLWVTDEEGNPAAVAPVSRRGSGDARVHVLYATPGSRLARRAAGAQRDKVPLVFGPDHPISRQAYRHQQPAAPASAGGGVGRRE
jgi:hypothetical protein